MACLLAIILLENDLFSGLWFHLLLVILCVYGTVALLAESRRCPTGGSRELASISLEDVSCFMFAAHVHSEVSSNAPPILSTTMSCFTVDQEAVESQIKKQWEPNDHSLR